MAAEESGSEKGELKRRSRGKYCCLPGCNKSSGNGEQLYLVPSGENRRFGVDTKEWAEKFHRVIFRYRYDVGFRSRVKSGKSYICRLHFEDSDIQFSSQRSWLKLGVLPTKNLPTKLHLATEPKPRRVIKKHPLQKEVKTFNYPAVENIVKEFNSIAMKKWRCHQIDAKTLHFTLHESPDLHACAAISLLVNQKENGSYSLSCGFRGIYMNEVPAQLCLKKLGISALLRHLADFTICSGYPEVANQTGWFFRNVYRAAPSGVVGEKRYFSAGCEVASMANSRSSVCNACVTLFVKQDDSERKRVKRLSKVLDIPLSKHCRLANASRERLEASLNLNQRRVTALESQLRECGVVLPCEVASAIDEVAQSDDFLKEWSYVQRRLQSTESKNRLRYPPSVIRYCLNLYAKSPAAYCQLKKIMVLPSKKTLSVKRNEYFGACNLGFQDKFAEELAAVVDEATKECDKHIVLAVDEMTVKEELVYRSSTSDIVGYVDFDNDTYNFLSRANSKIASHMLAVYVRGVTNKKLDGVIAFYATANVDSSELFLILTELLIEIPHQTSAVIVGVV